MSTAASATTAELSAVAEAIGEYQRRVGGLAAAHLGEGRDRDDELVAAIYEAERSLGVAERSLRRALKVAARGRR
jgi:hypothetical protein